MRCVLKIERRKFLANLAHFTWSKTQTHISLNFISCYIFANLISFHFHTSFKSNRTIGPKQSPVFIFTDFFHPETLRYPANCKKQRHYETRHPDPLFGMVAELASDGWLQEFNDAYRFRTCSLSSTHSSICKGNDERTLSNESFVRERTQRALKATSSSLFWGSISLLLFLLFSLRFLRCSSSFVRCRFSNLLANIFPSAILTLAFALTM